ncbi:MAG: adenylate/guanylate cyclase domain-containing protein [Rubrivivax sp.]|nr:adenylate/guanylate cyclase domain-containing protein [Rubrivivax sp.]
MAHFRGRDGLVVALVAMACGGLTALPALDGVRGLTLDVLTALRWQAYGPRHDPAGSPAVVVAIDEATYATPPFQGSPTITWTREIGRVLQAVVDGGAAVVGFDIVFPSSIEQSAIPFGEDAVGSRLRGFDRDFLRALNGAASQGKLVLGEVQHRDEPIRPAAGQRFAVGHQRNIRSLNAYSDADEVLRRLPLSFTVDGRPVPSMAVELAARALGTQPVFDGTGGMTLAGYRAPGTAPNTLTLNFEGGADDVPTYSLADLHACAAQGDTGYFRRQFAGKVVLLGTVTDTDDRRTTSKRWATGLEGAGAPRCALPLPPATGQMSRQTVAGVYVHATAVNNLLHREAVTAPGRTASAAIAVALAAVAAGAALLLAPWAAVLTTLAGAAAYTAGAVFAFRDALALPLLEPALAAAGALLVAIAWRVVIADKDGRFLRRSFGLYLAPHVIEQMLRAERLPALGGEQREVTVFFSDIAGFSSFSETLSPPELVALMNAYLSAMTDIVEGHGGYVDKYIGDAIVAVFGAPADEPHHARSAVSAALDCRDRLAQLNRDDPAFRARPLHHRIGLNSGPALVGNIGSRRRFNYTVMGDAVNLASRLEGANKFFATDILASETTVVSCGLTCTWREIDAIRVKGRMQAVRVFEPLAAAGQETAEQAARAAAYAAGLAAWRVRDFGAAAAGFARFAATDAPAAQFEQRALELAAHPPGADWEPVNTLQGK